MRAMIVVVALEIKKLPLQIRWLRRQDVFVNHTTETVATVNRTSPAADATEARRGSGGPRDSARWCPWRITNVLQT